MREYYCVECGKVLGFSRGYETKNKIRVGVLGKCCFDIALENGFWGYRKKVKTENYP